MKNNKVSKIITIIAVAIITLCFAFGQSYVDAGEGWESLGRAVLLILLVGVSILTIILTWLITAIISVIKKKKEERKDWYKPILIFLGVTFGIILSLVIIFSIKSWYYKKHPEHFNLTIENYNKGYYSPFSYHDIEDTCISLHENTIYINGKETFTDVKNVLIDKLGDLAVLYFVDDNNIINEIHTYDKDGNKKFSFSSSQLDNDHYAIYENGINMYRFYDTSEKEEYITACPTNTKVKVLETLTLEPKIAEIPGITCAGEKINQQVIHLGTYEKQPTYNRVITSYQEYQELLDDNNLIESDFNNNSYYLFTIPIDSCAERNITITKSTLENNTLHIFFTYDSSCGVCAMNYDTYLVKVGKHQTYIELDMRSKANNKTNCDPNISYKPLIYLYPEEKTDVTVKLGYPGKLTTTYPKYSDGWKVTAYPNGDLKDSHSTYYGLYWEGINKLNPVFEDGFVVKKENLISFLEDKLTILGLNDKERNEFIIYWLPILEKNEYNLIRFESIDNINKEMPLTINPKPDTLIRVLMEFKDTSKETKINEQKLTAPTRKGFTVVEWGGTIIK